ncbi:MAG TPA: BlaI/MecI/CopY family transcriptional regulator [Bryobacteraceae bacterium]|nr:BlaI/MecI/CopY family transcriptional regulator [Bryobacteraceae bacterium]
MARKKSPNLTDAELRLMDVLWEKGQATVSDVADALPQNPALAYSTVLTTLRILETKGFVRHTKDGRAFVYHPLVGREQARESAVTHLVRRFFENSPELLMLNLLDGKKVDAAELRRLRKKIEEAEA